MLTASRTSCLLLAIVLMLVGGCSSLAKDEQPHGRRDGGSDATSLDGAVTDANAAADGGRGDADGGAGNGGECKLGAFDESSFDDACFQ